MEQNVFDGFCKLIYESCGIVITEKKRALLENRLAKRLRSLHLKNHADYLNYLLNDTEHEELPHLLNAVSTNTTSFYREDKHFSLLRQIFESYNSERKKVRLWCAAASSGEEPYTISLVAHEYLNLNKIDFKILATDINTQVLEACERGIYTPAIVAPIPKDQLNKYFDQLSVNGDIHYRVKSILQEQILFRRFNLIEFPYKLHPGLDIIFCRNVMIYFDKKTRDRIVKEFYRLLNPGGYLIISHSENLIGEDFGFTRIGGSVFKKN